MTRRCRHRTQEMPAWGLVHVQTQSQQRRGLATSGGCPLCPRSPDGGFWWLWAPWGRVRAPGSRRAPCEASHCGRRWGRRLGLTEPPVCWVLGAGSQWSVTELGAQPLITPGDKHTDIAWFELLGTQAQRRESLLQQSPAGPPPAGGHGRASPSEHRQPPQPPGDSQEPPSPCSVAGAPAWQRGRRSAREGQSSGAVGRAGVTQRSLFSAEETEGAHTPTGGGGGPSPRPNPLGAQKRPSRAGC